MQLNKMVSVIVPNYNYRRFLKKRLRSILDQTYKDIELLFLDDGSTDGSIEYASEILKKSGIRYRIEVNKKNSGSVFKQWEKGIDLSNGEYIWIAEADDASDKTFLQKTLAVLESDPSVGFIYSGSSVIDERNRIISKDFYNIIYSRVSKTKWNKNYTADGMDEIYNSLSVMNTIPNVSAVLFRKSVFNKPFEIPINLSLSGDWLSYIKILENTKLSYIAENLNFNRIHKNRVTALLDTVEVYFDESLHIAEYLNSRFRIPADSQKKYIYNLFRQLSLTGGKYLLTDSCYKRIKKLFPKNIVEEVLVEFYNKLITEQKTKDCLIDRVKRLTIKKVISRCIKEKI